MFRTGSGYEMATLQKKEKPGEGRDFRRALERLDTASTGHSLTVGSSLDQLPVEGKTGHSWELAVPLA